MCGSVIVLPAAQVIWTVSALKDAVLAGVREASCPEIDMEEGIVLDYQVLEDFANAGRW